MIHCPVAMDPPGKMSTPMQVRDRPAVTDIGPQDCPLSLRERWLLSVGILMASATIAIGERLPARTSRLPGSVC